jgi:hypothetical protein
MKHMSEFVITRHPKMQKARNNAGNSLTFGFSGRIVSVMSTLLRSAEHEDIEEDSFSIAVHDNPRSFSSDGTLGFHSEACTIYETDCYDISSGLFPLMNDQREELLGEGVYELII